MKVLYTKETTIFSAGGVLVDQINKKVFLVFKNKTNEWLLPKGRIEAGEKIEETATREVYEETGYKNQATELLAVQGRPDINDPQKGKVIFWFNCNLTDEERHTDTQDAGENFSGQWFSKEEALQKLAWEEDKKLVGSVF